MLCISRGDFIRGRSTPLSVEAATRPMIVVSRSRLDLGCGPATGPVNACTFVHRSLAISCFQPSSPATTGSIMCRASTQKSIANIGRRYLSSETLFFSVGVASASPRRTEQRARRTAEREAESTVSVSPKGKGKSGKIHGGMGRKDGKPKDESSRKCESKTGSPRSREPAESQIPEESLRRELLRARQEPTRAT